MIERDLVERYFMDTYHWTPNQIGELSYKWVQKYFMFNKYKEDTIDAKRQIEEFKKENSGNGKTSRKR
jgi:hypothetical protein